MAYDPTLGYALLFGGSNGNTAENGTVFGDTWTYGTGGWSDITPSACTNSTCPEGRTYGAISYYDHAGQPYVVMFGGQYAGPSGVFLRDTWVFNGSWYNVTPKSLTPTNSPPALHYASMVWDPVDSDSVLYGGCATIGCNRTSEISDQTWAFKGLTAAGVAHWVNLTNSTHPPPLYGFGLTFDSNSSDVILFGGAAVPANKAVYADQTWSFTDATGWTNRTASHVSATNTPPARLFPMLTYYPGQNYTVLFGGQANTLKATSSNLNDTWTYWNGTWTNLTSALSSSPPGRFGGAIGYENTVHAVVLFGGLSSTVGSSTVFGDTWWFTGSPSGWSNQTTHISSLPPPAPPPSFRFSVLDYVIVGAVLVWAGIGVTVLLGRRKRRAPLTSAVPVPQPEAASPPSTSPPPVPPPNL